MTDVPGAGPVPSEMATLHQQVRGGHRPTVRRGRDRRVVARPEDHVVGQGELVRHTGDQSELAKFSDGVLHNAQGTVTLRYV